MSTDMSELPISQVNTLLCSLQEDAGPLRSVWAYVLRHPGKRIRSVLLLAAAALGPLKQWPIEAISAAAGVELIHEGSLIHDDITDSSLTRRGRASVYAEFGYRAAGLAGIHLATAGVRILAGLTYQGTSVVSWPLLLDLPSGQIMEIVSARNATDSGELLRQYQKAVHQKTGALFALAATVGVGFSGLSQTDEGRARLALATYCNRLSLAFQVLDDVRDIEGSATLGKAPGSDLRNSIATFPVIQFIELRKMSIDDFRAIVAMEPLEKITRAMMDSGAIDIARANCQQWLAEARGVISELDNSSHGASHLIELTHRVNV